MKKLIVFIFMTLSFLGQAFGKLVDENLAKNVPENYLVAPFSQTLPGKPYNLSLTYSCLSADVGAAALIGLSSCEPCSFLNLPSLTFHHFSCNLFFSLVDLKVFGSKHQYLRQWYSLTSAEYHHQ